MSTDTHFILEIKKKRSNKWKPIKVYDRTYHERKMILLTKNYPGFRSCMDFSFSNFKDRGLPLDVSKEVKDFLTEQKEEYGCWGISYISFSELYSMISHENKEMVLSLEKYGINHTTISLLKGIMDYLKNNNSSTFDDAIKDFSSEEYGVESILEDSLFTLSSLNDIESVLSYLVDLNDGSTDDTRSRIIFFFS